MLNKDLFSLIFYWMAEEALRSGHKRKELAKFGIKAGKVWDHIRDCLSCQKSLCNIIKREGPDYSFPADFLEIVRSFRMLNHYPASIKDSLLDHLFHCAVCQTKSLGLYKMGFFDE